MRWNLGAVDLHFPDVRDAERFLTYLPAVCISSIEKGLEYVTITLAFQKLALSELPKADTLQEGAVVEGWHLRG